MTVPERRSVAGFSRLWAAARVAERRGWVDLAAIRYIRAAMEAPTETEETLSLISGWICSEHLAGRQSELEVS